MARCELCGEKDCCGVEIPMAEAVAHARGVVEGLELAARICRERERIESRAHKYDTALVLNEADKEIRGAAKKIYLPAMFCNHANENPHGECTCPDNCACREHMCKRG